MRVTSPPDSGIPGIRLRQVERHDAHAWYDYLRLPEVHARTSWDVRRPADLHVSIDNALSDAPDSPRRLAVIDDVAQGALVGTIGFHTVSMLNRSAEIAYDFAPTHWGRGLATRLCNAVTRWSYGAQGLGLYRVQATVLVGNERSERVLQRCGFQHEGLLRGYRMVRGQPGDFHLYARLADDGPADLR